MEVFISLTVHWVDQNCYLHRWTSIVRHFPDRYSGTQTNIKIYMFEQLGLNTANILKYVVNDNASNAVKAIKLSPDLNQILCAIHTLQLRLEIHLKELRWTLLL